MLKKLRGAKGSSIQQSDVRLLQAFQPYPKLCPITARKGQAQTNPTGMQMSNTSVEPVQALTVKSDHFVGESPSESLGDRENRSMNRTARKAGHDRGIHNEEIVERL